MLPITTYDIGSREGDDEAADRERPEMGRGGGI